MNPIEFFFDFSSPYGYLAACRAAEIERAAGRVLKFTPYLMGAVFKTTGRQPLAHHPLVWEYAQNDLARSARRHEIPFNLPDPFPVATAAACRAYYFVLEREGADAARNLAMTLYRAYFVDGINIGETDRVVEITAGGQADRAALSETIAGDDAKQHLRAVTSEAARRGIFGSPFFIVDDQAFWGHDRIEDVIRWSSDGPW
jgi:2-hydroxychromene-2-carboxylate isomerase